MVLNILWISLLFLRSTATTTYTIGVQNLFNIDFAPTGRYLSEETGMNFVVKPLQDSELIKVCGSGGCDFTISTGSVFICLQLTAAGARNMNAILLKQDGVVFEYTAAAILTHMADNISDIQQLQGKRGAFSILNSVAGFLGQYMWLGQHDFNLFTDTSAVLQGKNSAALVALLEQRVVDFIFVPAQTTSDQFRVLDARMSPLYPFPFTVNLFGAPLFSASGHINYSVRAQVSEALLKHQVNDSAYYGWTTPAQYQSTRVVMSYGGVLGANNTCLPYFSARDINFCPQGSQVDLRACPVCPLNTSCFCAPLCTPEQRLSIQDITLATAGAAAAAALLGGVITGTYMCVKFRKGRETGLWCTRVREVFGGHSGITVTRVKHFQGNRHVLFGKWYDKDVVICVNGQDSCHAVVPPDHPNILQIYEHKQVNGVFWAVVEHCSPGKLHDALKHLNPQERLTVLKDVAAGLASLKRPLEGPLNIVLNRAKSRKLVAKLDLLYVQEATGGWDPSDSVPELGMLLWELAHRRQAGSILRLIIEPSKDHDLHHLIRACWMRKVSMAELLPRIATFTANRESF